MNAAGLPGNSFAEEALEVDLGDDWGKSAALVHALLAIAFEIRTANLFAATGYTEDVDKRLG